MSSDGLQRDVADGVHRIETGPVNWYLVEDESGVTAVDAQELARRARDAGSA